MCLNPKWIYKNGKRKENSYNGLKDEYYEIGLYSKCGSCEQCQNEKSNNWLVRNTYESKRWDKISFVTLTYAETPYILLKKDLQNFIKRLRRHIDYRGGEKLRYFAAGEYGLLNGRPHFHILIYNWNDTKAKYLDINKKQNILYKSEIIHKVWGKGRTSYQEFEPHEIPYISLYETPKEQFKRAYKMTLTKANTLRRLAKSNSAMSDETKKNLYKELNEIEKVLKKSKEEYLAIKEFNTWSTALGWEKFLEEYNSAPVHDFNCYIDDKIFAIPSPWVKKLANEGDIQAIEEMKRRTEEETEKSEEQLKAKNETNVNAIRKNDILSWKDKKTKEELL